jgi:hypothetical protein
LTQSIMVVLPPTVVVELLVAPAGTRFTLAALTAIVGLVLIVTLVGLGRGGVFRRLAVPAVGVLALSGVVCGAALPIGLDVAIALPFLAGILLVVLLDGRRLRIGLLLCWLAGLAGLGLARSSSPVQAIPNSAPVILAVLLAAVYTGVGYLILDWAARHWRWVAAESNAALEQARSAERAYELTALRLGSLVDGSPLPILAFDSEGTIHAWNPAAERLLGWAHEEAIGQPVWSFVAPELRPNVHARLKRTMDTGQVAGVRQTVFLTREGGTATAEIYDAVDFDADGKPAGVVVQFLDVSEREVMATRLLEAQRLEAIGQLAGGVAHDFNNSLTAIAGFASLIASGESPDPRDDARTILGAAEHAAILTKQLLAFSRLVPLRPQLTDLRDFLTGVEPLVRSLVGETIAVRLETDSRPSLVELDPASLEQAILNLATNARDGMPHGGELTMTVRTVAGCVSEISDEPETHVAVVVADTGTGIPPAAMGHIFEPFYTTKPPGKGTGLGLPMVHGFVAQSDGHVVVSSPPGQGATVELHFPPANGRVHRTDARTAPVGGTETVLFVEDDPAVASFGLACLRRLGYDVTPVMNGSEAVALAASRDEPFDLLLTDVVIPGMSGSELASLIHRNHPSTAILYASGYSSEHVDRVVMGPAAPLLEKPYSLDQLAAKVREVLDRRPAGSGRADRREINPSAPQP